MILTSLVSNVSERSGVSSGTFLLHTPRFHGLRSICAVSPAALASTTSAASPVAPMAPAPSVRPARAAASLGAASVSGRWQWAGTASPDTCATSAPQVAAVRVSPLLLTEMSRAASARGCSLSDIWAEAAREWLRHHTHEHEPEPQPPTPAAAALAVPRPTRSWAAIDTVLAELRCSPRPAA